MISMKQEKTTVAKQTTSVCGDVRCAVHGSLPTRGKSIVGKLINARMAMTGTIEIERRHYLPKYQRYEKRRTRIKVHVPACIGAKLGDTVKAAECRPLSKTKSFVIIEKVGGDHATN